MTCDLRTYTLYCVCVITSGCTRGAAAEENAIGKQQLATEAGTIGKQQAEAGAIGEQQLKQTQCTVLGEAAGADAIGVRFGLTTQD